MSKMKFPEYNPEIDYYQLVVDYEVKYNSHDYEKYPPEVVWNEKRLNGNKKNNDKDFHFWHCHNLYCYSKKRFLKDEFTVFENLNKKSDDFLWAFITVGWNEQTVTPKKMLSASLKIKELKYFSKCEFVLEKHRENGIHHHTHFLVEFSEKYPPSKIINWIFGLATVKEICREASFVDYLGPQKPKKHYEPHQVYYDYIRGKKKVMKLPFVELDTEWRKENCLEDLYG